MPSDTAIARQALGFHRCEQMSAAGSRIITTTNGGVPGGDHGTSTIPGLRFDLPVADNLSKIHDWQFP